VSRSVKFELVADPTRYVRGMRQAQRSSEKFTDHTNKAGRAVKTAFAAFSAATVVMEMGRWVAAARDANRVAAQTDAVIRSTRGAAGLSARGFSDLAKQIMRTTAVDDDLIQSGENILATFTRIKAGGPERVFERASMAAVNMTAALNQGRVTAEGLKAANLVLGKALQDPIAGLSRLQRVGVSFSAQQKQQIADFVKHGQTAKAQGVILAEVNKEFGGSAAAAVTPAKRLAVTWGNMQEVLGNLLIPALDRGATIMAGFLDVVDHNRKVFGVLFGMLGAGAAIIGTLVVAEKVHAAVTDGVKVATAAWSATQKGLNVVLGATRVQAAETAATEGALATSTAAAGTAAAGASAGFGALAGRLALFGGAAAAAAIVAGKLSSEQGRQTAIVDRHGSILDRVKRATTVFGFAQDKAKDSTKAATTATQASGMASQGAAAKMALNAAKATELSGKLKGLKQDFAGQVKAVKDSVLAYDGLISKSGITAKQVIGDLHNQVTNFKTYSKDVQRLIRAGVNPAAIQELSTKGPQYVHALATGSNAQLQTYKKYWRDRQAEVKGSFAASMQKQYEDLVRKMRAMQAEINKLKGKNVNVTATASATIAKQTIAWLRAAHVKIPQLAGGGKVLQGSGPTADDVLARLSKGETIVSARDSSRPEFQTWAKQRQIPGYATGGRVGSLQPFTDASASALGRGTQHAVNALAGQLGKALGKMINNAFSGIGGAGGPLPSGGGAGAALARKVAIWTASTFRRAGEAGAWYRRLMMESGGNPSIVNKWDSNWARGTPSVGIAQVIGPTFRGNAGPYRRTGPFLYGVSINPYANSYAGGHYAIGRYGSLAAVDPRVKRGGYDSGGWLPPGLSLAYNGTGRPEPVGPTARTINVTVPLTVYGEITAAQRAQMHAIAEDMGETVAAELSDALARRGSGV
jgi:hypothetical protein